MKEEIIHNECGKEIEDCVCENAPVVLITPNPEQGMNPTVKHSMKCPQLYGEDCNCMCDGYHTFNELYDHRITLFVALCRLRKNVIIKTANVGPSTIYSGREVWRSKLHSDETSFDGWFILGIGKENGRQITYHLPLNRWEETDFAETLEKAPEWDGHTSDDVLERLKAL